jgi:membrane-bound lytic murein transglycosylase D
LQAARTKIASRLADEKTKLADLGGQDQRIAQLLLQHKETVSLEKDDLLQSLKARNGFAHRFKSALVNSGRYMEDFRKIFRERGVPEDLTVIPFFESAFVTEANSHAGAVGVWQFIEDTGKRYLRIDEFVDERRDPILAAYAAATHLKKEYGLLKSWPLTINAYNTGPGRMKDAQEQLETNDIATIIKKYKGSGYGFDSRNYYPEFLAALTVYSNREHYFGQVETLPPEPYEYIATPSPVNLVDLAKMADMDLTTLLNLNVALNDDVAQGNRDLPRGYLLKIPPETKQSVLFALQDIHQELMLATHYVVKNGDTLPEIAAMYEVPVEALAFTNDLLPKQTPQAGQILRLPSRGEPAASLSATATATVPSDSDTQNETAQE